MRIRVELDVSKPLKKGRKINAGGISASVEFKYERLHTFCYICGKLGHSEQYCEVLFNSPWRDWDAGIWASDRRNGQTEGD